MLGRTSTAARPALVLLLAVAVLSTGWAALARKPPRAPKQPAHMFAPTSFWNTPIAPNAPLDKLSSVYVRDLVNQARSRGVWINARQFSTPIYTVGKREKRQPVTIDRPSDMSTNGADAARLEHLLSWVPIPRRARPAGGTDRHMVIWQPATDTMWELWQAHRVPVDPCPCKRPWVRGWHAAWGARIDHVSQSSGVDPYPFGATASGLPVAGGMMRLNELRKGRIDHALALAIPDVARGRVRAPANRTDGEDPRPMAIAEGTRLRLDPSVDVASLGLSPVGRMMAEAAQRYGIVVRDRARAVVFYAEDPGPGGGDPYPALFGGQQPSDVLAGFPWDRLQVLAPGE
jgi:hypothetical protein